MVKSYLRYAAADEVGVIHSPNSSICVTSDGVTCYTACLEHVGVWNLRRGLEVGRLHSSLPYEERDTITKLSLSHNDNLLAAGMTNGSISLFNTQTRTEKCLLSAHSSQISCLVFDDTDTILVSGSNDTDIVVWDLVAEVGLYRLRGHKDQITDLCVLSNPRLIISSSKDKLVKVWDMDTQHCQHTVTHHSTEVWSIAMGMGIPSSASSSSSVPSLAVPHADSSKKNNNATLRSGGGCFVVTATAGPFLSVFHLAGSASPHGLLATPELHLDLSLPRPTSIRPLLVRFYPFSPSTGTVIPNPKYNTTTTDNASADGSVEGGGEKNGQGFVGLLVCVNSDKSVDLWLVRSTDAARKRRQRRMQRKREKARKAADTQTAEPEDESEEFSDKLIARDVFHALPTLKCAHKIAWISLCKPASNRGTSSTSATKSEQSNNETSSIFARMVIAFQNNSLEVVDMVGTQAEGRNKAGGSAVVEYKVVHEISSWGHSSDVRAVIVNRESSLVASAASGEIKIWGVESRQCIRTVKTGYALCCLFVPGNRQMIVGTKEGALEIIDVASASVLERIETAHSGTIWALSLHPNGLGFASASRDKSVKFWSFQLTLDAEYSDTTKRLTLQHERTLEMTDEVLCVHHTNNPNKTIAKHVAVSLLDCTVKIFFEDSLKFFLSLYGHKLPVLCMDSSSDGELLITGSGDKNVKIWGLDFGDCHKSLFAHDGPVTQVRFVPETHHFFSLGKDGLLKYWDADTFTSIFTIKAHFSDGWGLAIAPTGTFVCTCSRDRSIRFFDLTEEQVFVEEEREKEMETRMRKQQEEENARMERGGTIVVKLGGSTGESANAGKLSVRTLGASEAIMEAVEAADAEIAYRLDSGIDLDDLDPTKFSSVLLGALRKTPHEHVLSTLTSVPAADLETALVFVPLNHVFRLLEYLKRYISQGKEVELCVRCVCILLRAHHTQITSNAALVPTLSALLSTCRSQLGRSKALLGTNSAALALVRREMETAAEGQSLFRDAVEALQDKQDRKRRRRR